MNRILLATILSITLTLPTEAQWTLERNAGNSLATAVSAEGKMHLTVNCRGNNQAIVLELPGTNGFHSEVVEALWDDGKTERYSLKEESEGLSGSSESPEVKAFIDKLRQNSMVHLHVSTGPEEVVSDSIDLTGSSSAIGSLQCGLSDDRIRSILVSQSVARYSGSCACPYNRDRGGRRCGGRSAYSRPGGASPLCYPRDVSDAAVEAYRRRAK